MDVGESLQSSGRNDTDSQSQPALFRTVLLPDGDLPPCNCSTSLLGGAWSIEPAQRNDFVQGSGAIADAPYSFELHEYSSGRGRRRVSWEEVVSSVASQLVVGKATR